jgi:hypothetical protein
MFEKVIIPLNRILDLLKMLTRHPGLMPIVNSVDLGNYWQPDLYWLTLRDLSFDLLAGSVLRDTLPTWDTIQSYRGAPMTYWPQEYRYLLDILVSLCPNIKDLV